MIIGIMGAMIEEVDGIRAQMTNISMTELGDRQYYIGFNTTFFYSNRLFLKRYLKYSRK